MVLKARPSRTLLAVAGLAAASPAARIAADWLNHQPSLCPLQRFAGVPCPSCGGTRAGLYLLGADPVAAFAANPGVTAAALTFGALVVAGKVSLDDVFGVANPQIAVAD